MLIDKGYYDYDYEKPKRPRVVDVAPKNQEETRKMVARFGIGVSAKPTAEELQKLVMSEIGETTNGKK